MKVKVLLGTATVLALVWGGLVVNAVNDPIKTDEPKEKVVHVDAVEVVPETVSEPVHEVLEPESVQAPVVENKPVEEPDDTPKYSVRKHIRSLFSSDEEAECFIRYSIFRDRSLANIPVENWNPGIVMRNYRILLNRSHSVCETMRHIDEARAQNNQ